MRVAGRQCCVQGLSDIAGPSVLVTAHANHLGAARPLSSQPNVRRVWDIHFGGLARVTRWPRAIRRRGASARGASPHSAPPNSFQIGYLHCVAGQDHLAPGAASTYLRLRDRTLRTLEAPSVP